MNNSTELSAAPGLRGWESLPQTEVCAVHLSFLRESRLNSTFPNAEALGYDISPLRGCSSGKL